jgi:hypothetical protein
MTMSKEALDRFAEFIELLADIDSKEESNV